MFKWFGKVNFVPYTKVSDFAGYLKDGHLMGSRCKVCGSESFPPRADCSQCLSGNFEYTEYSGRAKLVSYTQIHAAPTGFEDVAPYTIGVVDLEENGRLLAWFGDTISDTEIRIGMELQVVPRIFEELQEIRVYYSLEKPGTTWSVAESGP
ncbi:MAG: Zn-ribbon domain-containing OB-fold protein [Candidatus Zixiibacteriota bacterium]|nr:MAG: Zn-ribbon domain-containing OB-fold protein [candidate division Zixibacteria bacterium]